MPLYLSLVTAALLTLVVRRVSFLLDGEDYTVRGVHQEIRKEQG